eukprot:3449023-Amphidinium_carterae.1
MMMDLTCSSDLAVEVRSPVDKLRNTRVTLARVLRACSCCWSLITNCCHNVRHGADGASPFPVFFKLDTTVNFTSVSNTLGLKHNSALDAQTLKSLKSPVPQA